MRYDYKQRLPYGMEEYIEIYGWHFSKKMCDWAVSMMYSDDEGINTSYDKDRIDSLLNMYGITLKNSKGYDYVYVANMGKSDFMGKSITDEHHLMKFVKDYIDDKDGYDGMPFTRFYADCIGKGNPICWNDMI